MTYLKSLGARLAPVSGALAIALAAGFAAVPAEAAMLTCSTGTGGSAAAFRLADATDVACFGGNDTNRIDSSFALFGKTGWTLSQKNDGPDGDKTVTFGTAPRNGTKSGVWSIDSFAGLTDVVITLKAGSGFGAFLLDTRALAGTWSISKALSHASIYYNGTPPAPTPAPVPLPAAAWLLLGGLGGLGFVGRRRKAA